MRPLNAWRSSQGARALYSLETECRITPASLLPPLYPDTIGVISSSCVSSIGGMDEISLLIRHAFVAEMDGG